MSFNFSLLCLLSEASLAVHVGLWNGVDWMVGFVFFRFFFCFFLTPVSKLIGIIRTEVSVAPNVELMERQRQILLTVMKQITIKCGYVPNCFEWGSNNLSSTLHVKWSRETKKKKREWEGDREPPCNVCFYSLVRRSLHHHHHHLIQLFVLAHPSWRPTTPQTPPSLLLLLFHYIHIPASPHKPSHAFPS